MKTTIDHLLTPRFEVIADYPYSPHSIGDLLTDEWEIPTIHLYPHLFKPLQWWEKRTEDEMPMYLKANYSGEIDYIKVHSHFKHHSGNWKANSFEIFISGETTWVYSGWEPCSEEEYLNNMNL